MKRKLKKRPRKLLKKQLTSLSFLLIISPIIAAILIISDQAKICYAEEAIKQVNALIHVSSTVSDGKLTIPEIVKIARENDIRIVILTDMDFMRWQYG